ncbi:MAG: hypothetical protein Q8930_00925 [Bacillota bacterium]|nr:hypothetical protein [Bacillota bacterium]
MSENIDSILPENNTIQNSNFPTIDTSKIKIRTILKDRIKKHKFSFKKIIPYIIVGFICFAAGLGFDRLISKHPNERIIKNQSRYGNNFQRSNNNTQGSNKNRMIPNNRQSKNNLN